MEAGTGLTHLDEQGRARMVDVGAKPVTARMARARAVLRIRRSTWELVKAGGLAKGDALAVARVAGIMAAKETSRLIPLCHPIPLSSVEVAIEEEPARSGHQPIDQKQEPESRPEVQGPSEGREPAHPQGDEPRIGVIIEATVRTAAQTGVEMEALAAASLAALALYDMCKAHDRAMVIERIALMEKRGGVRGDFLRQEEPS